MAEIRLNNKLIDLNKIREGVQVDTQNKFLQKYDTDGNSIFSAQEINALQSDLEKYAGNDKTLQSEEYLKFYSEKMQVSLAEAAQKFSQYGNIVEKGVMQLFSSETDKIAKDLGDVIDDNLQFASVESDKFKNSLSKINSSNIVDVLKSYKKQFNGEQLATDIMREKTVPLKSRLKVVKALFNMLYHKIDRQKYSTAEVEKIYNDFLSDPTSKKSIKQLNKVFDTMIAMIEGADAEGEIDTDMATSSAQKRAESASATVSQKAASQGGVSKALDNIAPIWAGMTEEKAHEIIKEHKEKLAILESKKGNYEEYCAEFEKIFGVKYKPAAVANYNKLQTRYNDAANYYVKEQLFLTTFEKELNAKDSDIDLIYSHKGEGAAQKKFDELYSKICNYFKDGKKLVDNYLLVSNADKMTANNKYKLLRDFLIAQKEMHHQMTFEACGGMEFSELEADRNSAYHAAYGTQSDVYLVATDWVNSQNRRFATVQTGFNLVAMAGAMFTGGGTALVASALLIADPIGFAEQATDIDGMTKDDWNCFFKDKAENIGWMALGMGAGVVGQATSKMLKLKGASHLMKNGGKSIDDLLKNPNLPQETMSQLNKMKNLADLAGISTEVLVDITTTALLQKEGATIGDWIMSLGSAIAGSPLAGRLVKMNQANAIKALQETFPDLKMTKDDALKVLQNINDKAKQWAETPTSKNDNRLNSSVVGATPEMVENGVKSVVRKVSNAVSKWFKNVDNKNYLNNTEKELLAGYAKKKPKFASAIEDGINEISHRVSNGEYPSREMKAEIIKGLSEKYPELDAKKLQDELEYVMEVTLRQEGWRGIALCMKYSEKWGLDEGYDKCILQPFKEQKGWVEKTDTPKVDEVEKPKAETVHANKNATDDALMKKYPQVSETSFYGGIEAQREALRFIEEYSSIMQKEGINFENFHEKESLIYQYISGLNLHPEDYDVVFKLVKEHYHQDVVKNDARVDNLCKQFNLNNREYIEAGDKIIEDIRNKINSDEKIDDNYIKGRLCELLPNEYDSTYKKIEEYINSHDDIRVYIDDCTHRDIYNNPKYTNLYQKETIDNCVKVLDWILADVKNGKPLTREMVDEYMNHGAITMVEFGQEFLDEILSKHRILGPMYLKIKE